MFCQAVAGGEEAGVGADIVGRLPELTGAKQNFSNVSVFKWLFSQKELICLNKENKQILIRCKKSWEKLTPFMNTPRTQ